MRKVGQVQEDTNRERDRMRDEGQRGREREDKLEKLVKRRKV